MPVWLLGVIAATELTLTMLLVVIRDREYTGRAIAFWNAAGVAGIGIDHFETGSWRSAVLVPVLAYPVGWVVTRCRPGVMFKLMDQQRSPDAVVRDAARRAGWRLAIELCALGLIVAAVMQSF